MSSGRKDWNRGRGAWRAGALAVALVVGVSLAIEVPAIGQPRPLVPPAPSDEGQSDRFPKPDADGTVEVTLTSSTRTLVLLLSGDGGWWGDIDAQLARDLGARGYGVIGLDTSIYFNSERTRPEMLAHVKRLLRDYGRRMKAERIVLAGYSFGANMVPLIYNDLPWTDKVRVANLVLIAPEQSTNLEVTLAGRIGIGHGDVDLAPEFLKLPPAATACIYGLDEADESGCVLAGIHLSSRLPLPGGHHFDGDPAHLSKVVFSVIESALRAPHTDQHHVR